MVFLKFFGRFCQVKKTKKQKQCQLGQAMQVWQSNQRITYTNSAVKYRITTQLQHGHIRALQFVIIIISEEIMHNECTHKDLLTPNQCNSSSKIVRYRD